MKGNWIVKNLLWAFIFFAALLIAATVFLNVVNILKSIYNYLML